MKAIKAERKEFAKGSIRQVRRTIHQEGSKKRIKAAKVNIRTSRKQEVFRQLVLR